MATDLAGHRPGPGIMRAIALWRNLVRRRAVEHDLDAELKAHLNLLTDEKIAAGATRAEAERAAALEVGGLEVVKDQVRDARTGALVEVLARDLRYGWRLVRRDPGFTVTAALSLAIGIGANATIFTLAKSLLFAPPAAVVAPSQLVDIGPTRNGSPNIGTSSYPNYADIRDR